MFSSTSRLKPLPLRCTFQQWRSCQLCAKGPRDISQPTPASFPCISPGSASALSRAPVSWASWRRFTRKGGGGNGLHLHRSVIKSKSLKWVYGYFCDKLFRTLGEKQMVTMEKTATLKNLFLNVFFFLLLDFFHFCFECRGILHRVICTPSAYLLMLIHIC